MNMKAVISTNSLTDDNLNSFAVEELISLTAESFNSLTAEHSYSLTSFTVQQLTKLYPTHTWVARDPTLTVEPAESMLVVVAGE